MGMLATLKGNVPGVAARRSEPAPDFGFLQEPSREYATKAAQAFLSDFLKSKYDAAQDTDANRKHWSMVDYLSADASLNPSVRRKLRARCRYEAQNNPYLAGITQTIGAVMAGTGPRLRLDLPGSKVQDVQDVERRFFDWCNDIQLGEKVRLMRSCQVTDEPFAMLISNPRLPDVQLDLRTIESDQVAEPWPRSEMTSVDGLKLDRWGNVESYHILDAHPGATVFGSVTAKGRWVSSRDVIHWPHLTRPDQYRGCGQIVPALEIFGQLRRFINATLTAAEVAACFAAIMKTLTPPNGRDAAEVGEWETMPLMRGMVTALPEGWDVNQLKAEHPNVTFTEFVRLLVGMAARACNMPVIVALMDATGANYSTMRGDYLVLRKFFDVDRSNAERVILDRLFRRWFDEAIFLPRHIPRGLPPFIDWNWSWAWDDLGHIDPVKEAAAEQIRLESHTETLARLYAKKGLNWKEELTQAAVEKQFMRDNGLTIEDVAPKTRAMVKQAIVDSLRDDEEIQEGLAKAA